MNTNTELPYPPHNPPAAPEGMRWEYRGMGWSKGAENTTFYALKSDTGELYYHRLNCPGGGIEFHYFEAVPLLKDSGFTENPKEAAGRVKCPMHLLPPEFLRQTANVLGYGAYDAPRIDEKNGYGPWNWRDQPIKMSTYLGAILRHWSEILDGNLIDKSHGQSHFASIAANCAIVLDAMKQGTLVDDRPQRPYSEEELMQAPVDYLSKI